MNAEGFETSASRRKQAAKTKVLVVGPYLTDRAATHAFGEKALRSQEARLDEAEGLALAIDVEIVGREFVLLPQIRPATYLGKGKVEELAELIKEREAELIVVDCALSPVQQRNLEKALAAKVIDRTGLILEIFGARARTARGRAAGRAGASDLPEVAAGALLDPPGAPARRLRLSGRPRRNPDRDRPAADRRAHRQASSASWKASSARAACIARARQRAPFPIVALVGYTNAGKSTLFNRLTDAGRRRQGPAVRHARPHLARPEAAARRPGDPVRHGGIHLRPAARSGRGLPRHAGRGAGGRRHPACARHRP